MLFFYRAPATFEVDTLSLHDALPIWRRWASLERTTGKKMPGRTRAPTVRSRESRSRHAATEPSAPGYDQASSFPSDRKSTRLNSSHQIISYAVFCLKKKKKKQPTQYA